MSGKFELSKSKNEKFMFNLKAGNGEVVLTSQMYESKPSALQGIESVRNNAPIDARYERKASSKGEPFFNLKATNGQVIGHSEMCSSTSAMEGGITSVKKNAPDAKLVDLAV
ncbi:MAG: YegP family protein [Burkholderiales bacterium]